jgi:hypothetical protein
MHTIETTDPIKGRRARYAQYRSQEATLTLMGSTITGMVRSVNEHGAGKLKRWVVTVREVGDLYSTDRSDEIPRPRVGRGNLESASVVNRERLGQNLTTGLAGNNPRICDLMNRAASDLGTLQGRPQLPPRWGRFFWRWRFIECSNLIEFFNPRSAPLKKRQGIGALRLAGFEN